MRYRIKKIQYKNGRVEYIPQAKPFLIWKGMLSNGELASIDCEYSSRNEAFDVIEKHHSGNTSVLKVEYEEILK